MAAVRLLQASLGLTLLLAAVALVVLGLQEALLVLQVGAELLARLFNAAPQGIAVGGTSGKSTVSSLS